MHGKVSGWQMECSLKHYLCIKWYSITKTAHTKLKQTLNFCYLLVRIRAGCCSHMGCFNFFLPWSSFHWSLKGSFQYHTKMFSRFLKLSNFWENNTSSYTMTNIPKGRKHLTELTTQKIEKKICVRSDFIHVTNSVKSVALDYCIT